MRPLIEEIKMAISNNDHYKLISIFIDKVEGYENKSI